MKKVMITSGVFSVITFIAGSFFKIMHWPGASVLLLLGILMMSFIFLPLMFLLKTKDVNSGRDKLIAGIGTLAGILTSLFILFKVMHWPGGNTMGLAALCMFSFVFIPIYFFTGIRYPERKLNTIVTTIILVGVAGLQFTLVNTRPAKQQTEIKMYSYIQSEELLSKMQHKSSSENKLAAEINTTATQIKELILERMIGQRTISKDFEGKNIFVEDDNLDPEFFINGKGGLLFSHLKETVDQYNASLNKEEDKIPIGHFENDRIGLYSDFVVLNYIVQIQMYVVIADQKLTAEK